MTRGSDGYVWSPSTVAIHAGRPAPVAGAPLNEPVSLTSTYVAGGERVYARVTNASAEAFEQAVGALEGGSAVAFASGMAAVSGVMGSLHAGARVVIPERAYAGTLQYFVNAAQRGVLVVDQVDVTDPTALTRALDGADVLWLESPVNPTLEIIDIARTAALAHEAGARVVVDNTFATPINQRPLALGADVVVHSASKFLSGHSDVILGVAVGADPSIATALREQRTVGGAVPGPLDAYLALRGMRTLSVRMRQGEANAAVLAERLAVHPSVSRVRYPGRPHDPGHALAAEQMDGFGAMLAFEHADGAEAAEATCQRTQLWTHATSLGGVESTLERRRRWEFEPPSVPAALIRLSVGCEDVEDLWSDLAASL